MTAPAVSGATLPSAAAPPDSSEGATGAEGSTGAEAGKPRGEGAAGGLPEGGALAPGKEVSPSTMGGEVPVASVGRGAGRGSSGFSTFGKSAPAAVPVAVSGKAAGWKRADFLRS